MSHVVAHLLCEAWNQVCGLSETANGRSVLVLAAVAALSGCVMFGSR